MTQGSGKWRPLLGLILSLLVLQPACQGRPKANPPVSSKLQVIQHTGCQLSPQQSEALVQGFLQIEQIYNQTLATRATSGPRIGLQLFCQLADYQAYTRAAELDPEISATGYYLVESRQIVIFSQHSLNRSLQTIYHEGSHALLRSLPGNYPKWLNEGLAEYFEGGLPQPGKLVVLPQSVKEKRLQSMRLTGHLPGLKAFLAMTDSQWQTANAPEPIAGSLSWSLVYFLMESPGGQAILRQLIQRYRLQAPAADDLNRLYPGGIPQLERAWQAWLTRPRKPHDWPIPEPIKN